MQIIKRCHFGVIAGLALGLLACSTVNSGEQKYSVSDAGYASVKTAPAAARDTQPYDSSSAFSDAINYTMMSRKYADEAKVLEAQLRNNEAENFVEYRLVWEPYFHYLFSFLNDAETTLAKYSSNPIFKPNTVKHTAEALEAKSTEFHNALAALYPKYNLAGESSVDVVKGKVVANLGLYEEDFDTFPTLDRFRNDPMVELRYNGPLDPPEVLSAEAALLIRHFAHGTIQEPMVVIGYTEGKIRLKDGCFFLDDGKRKDQLVVFPKRVGVTRDDEGYISLLDRSPHPGEQRPTRVGEPARWNSGPRPVTDPEILTPLIAACGVHDVVIISTPYPNDGE